MTKPMKNGTESKDEYNERLKKATPTATRHLYLIRHGQYNMSADSDDGRGLTLLGKVNLEPRVTVTFFEEVIKNKQFKGEVNSIISHSKNEGLNNMNKHGLKRIFKKCHIQQK